jgi:hypothetical protein
MIKKYSKFDYNGLEIEANYSDEVIPCKKIKFTIGDKSAEIDRSDLYNLLVLFADDEEMDKCLNIKSRKVVMIKKMVKVQTKEAIPAGGDIVFPIEYPIAEEDYEQYMEDNKDKLMKSEEAKKELENYILIH